MKVVFDLREVLFQRRGWQRYGVGLLNKLIHFDGLECSYIVQNTKLAKESFPFLFSRPVKTIEMRINPLPREGLPTDDFIEQHDLFHSLTDYPEFIPRKARLVTSIHDVTFKLFSAYRDRRFVKLMSGNLNVAARHSKAIICFTETTRRRLADILKKRLTAIPTIEVIPHGVYETPALGQKTLKAVRNKFHINAPYLLYVGGFEKDKNVGNLVEAFLRVRNHEGQMLVLAGPQQANSLGHKILRAYVKKSRQIKVLGYVSDEELLALYTGADFFVSPSLDEGFGFCPLEALRCKTPVLCSDIPCFREVLSKSAAYFDPYDLDSMRKCLEDALNHKALLKKKAGTDKIVSKFDWEKAAKSTFNLYRKVLRDNPS